MCVFNLPHSADTPTTTRVTFQSLLLISLNEPLLERNGRNVCLLTFLVADGSSNFPQWKRQHLNFLIKWQVVFHERGSGWLSPKCGHTGRTCNNVCEGHWFYCRRHVSETTVPILKVSPFNTKMAEHVRVSDDSIILTGTIYGILNECVCSRGVTVHKRHSRF